MRGVGDSNGGISEGGVLVRRVGDSNGGISEGGGVLMREGDINEEGISEGRGIIGVC